ncbi:hypothetical protein PybrP1_006668 [[Pythium] brassicae (nom. inval.)]|nr:hypothetical protein PybrP1_006668 [[Pythium] brassicae (nom. inval.)]
MSRFGEMRTSKPAIAVVGITFRACVLPPSVDTPLCSAVMFTVVTSPSLRFFMSPCLQPGSAFSAVSCSARNASALLQMSTILDVAVFWMKRLPWPVGPSALT